MNWSSAPEWGRPTSRRWRLASGQTQPRKTNGALIQLNFQRISHRFRPIFMCVTASVALICRSSSASAAVRVRGSVTARR
jgi:hypothetical protein